MQNHNSHRQRRQYAPHQLQKTPPYNRYNLYLITISAFCCFLHHRNPFRHTNIQSYDILNGPKLFIITQTINDEIYATSLYEYNGFLYELFSKVSIELTPDSGQKILPLSELDFEFVSPSLLSARYIDDLGNDTVVYVSLHTTENTSSDK